MKLSIVIPVYNEILSLNRVLTKVIQVLPTVSKELIIIDDGSTDGTREWLTKTFGEKNACPLRIALGPDQQLLVDRYASKHQATPKVSFPKSSCADVRVIFHPCNRGKGAALRTGFQAATGDVFVIQDADLEYDPHDWHRMWRLIVEDWADVVYGSRFYGEPHRVLYFHHLMGNKIISNLINILCNTTLSDIEVCYKMFRREVLEGMQLTCNDFGFEVEFTMKMAKSPHRWRLYELGIAYYGRTYTEGKKINWIDGIKALYYIMKFWVKS